MPTFECSEQGMICDPKYKSHGLATTPKKLTEQKIAEGGKPDKNPKLAMIAHTSNTSAQEPGSRGQ